MNKKNQKTNLSWGPGDCNSDFAPKNRQFAKTFSQESCYLENTTAKRNIVYITE